MWKCIQGLAGTLNWRRDAKMRQMVVVYVHQIVAAPSTKTGLLMLNPAAGGPYKKHDRPAGLSCVNVVTGARYSPLHIMAAFRGRFRFAA